MLKKCFWFGSVSAKNFDKRPCRLAINYDIIEKSWCIHIEDDILDFACTHNYLTVVTLQIIYVFRLDNPELAYSSALDKLSFERYTPTFIDPMNNRFKGLHLQYQGTMLTSTSRTSYLVAFYHSKSIITRLFNDAELAEHGKFSISILQFPFDSTIVAASSGYDHTLFLSNEGSVYSFGTGNHGELGLFDTISTHEPMNICAFEGVKIKKVAAGGWHSVALTDSNDVYVWGWNNKKQLGDELEEIETLPTPLNLEYPAVDIEVHDCVTEITIENGTGERTILKNGTEISF